ncbi:MAG TPA: hypothetical protein VG389_28270 [Myxococcota bacterium]|jgi:hypothetical protein|nr:hypothetical protein [Myxococcota bacterium]
MAHQSRGHGHGPGLGLGHGLGLGLGLGLGHGLGHGVGLGLGLGHRLGLGLGLGFRHDFGLDLRSARPEGRRRAGKDRLQSYRIAAGSADEVRAALLVAAAWGWLPEPALAAPLALLDRLLALTWRLTH